MNRKPWTQDEVTILVEMYLKKTKDVIQLADILGHGSVETTRIYLQKSFTEQKRDINRVVSW